MNGQDSRRRVVILGGGFAGLFAARMLARAPVAVTLLDRAEHHLFQPLLYQCATGILSEGKIAAPLRQLLAKHRNVEFVIAEATGLDAAGRRVLARRPLGEQVEFGYDYLILAAGRPAVLLRARRVRPDRARDEDHRGRDEDPAADLRRVRDGRVRRRPGRTGPLAHLRPGRRRADRRGAGRADPRGRDQDAAQRVPAHQSGGRPGAAVRRRRARRWRCSARSCPPWPPATWASWGSSCTWARSSPTWTPAAWRSRTTTAR